MNIVQSLEGFTRDAIIIGAEIVLLLLLYFLISSILRLFFNRFSSLSFLQKYQNQSDKIRHGIKGILILLCIVSCAAVIFFNGYLIYQQKDVYEYTLGLFSRIPQDFWRQLGFDLVKIFALFIAAPFFIRPIARFFAFLKEKAKAYNQLESNDESIEKFFTTLERIFKNSIWLLVLIFSWQILSLPIGVANSLFIILKIYLIISIGLLVGQAAAAFVDSLGALSKKYWYRDNYLDWYNRLSGLMPLFRRCLEYIIYVWVASLVMLQVNFIAQFAAYGPAAVQIIGIFFLARVVVEVSNLLVDKKMSGPDEIPSAQQQQRKTIIPIIKTLLQSLIYFIAFILMLRAVNINPLPLLAGAGILGVVVGMGAQPIINDIVSGFFILFENLFLIGDYIETDPARGIVEEIHIRTTYIRDPNGQLHILRNGQIGAVVNFSKEFTFAVVEVGVAYDSDLEHVFTILEETGRQFKEKNPDVLEPLMVRGLKEFGQSELLVRTTTKVKPGCHYQVAYQLRKMIKEAFDRENIEIPFVRRVLIFQKDNQAEPATG